MADIRLRARLAGGLFTSDIAKDATSQWVVFGINVLVGLALTPIIIAHLGKEQFGVWVLLSSVVGYYGLFDLGMTTATMRFTSLYLGTDSPEEVERVAATSLFFFGTVAVILVFVSIFLGDTLSRFFQIDPASATDFRVGLVLLGFGILFRFPSNVFSAVLRGHYRYTVTNTFNGIGSLIQFGLSFCALKLGFGISGLAGTALAVSVFLFFSHFLYVRLKLSHLITRWRHFDKAVLFKLLSFGAPAFLIVVGDLLNSQFDSLLIGRLMGVGMVATYSIASAIARYLSAVATAPTSVLTPRFSMLEGQNRQEQLTRLFNRSINVSTIIAYTALAVLVIVGGRIIELWVGNRFVDAYWPMLLLSFGAVITASQAPLLGVLYAKNKHRLFAISNLAEGILHILLSYLLCRQFGLRGVAIGAAVSSSLIRLIVQPYYAAPLLGLTRMTYYRKTIPIAVFAAVVLGLVFANDL